jgi:hypothetical protein
VDITTELVALVMFGPAEGSRGSEAPPAPDTGA